MAAARPKLLRAESYPVIPLFRQYARKQEIDSILNEHSFGSFGRPSQLIDELMTDDRISGTIETRIGGLLSAELEIRPARDRRRERKLAELLGGVDDSKGLWPSIVSPAAAFEILKWGHLNGIAVAQIAWERGPAGEWLPRLCPWHPRHLRWDWSARCLKMQTANMGEVALPDLEANPEGDGNWFIWAPHGLALGWLNGMVRSLAHLYLMRQWSHRDWARYCEKHGMSILKALVPQWAKPKEKQDWLDALSNLGSESAVACPTGKKDEGSFDMALVEAQARTWEAFKDFLTLINNGVAIRVLGQNLTTEGGTDGGSRALGQVHDLVRLDKAIEDAGIGDAFSRQILRPWARYNYGDPELAPVVIYHVEPPANLAQEALGLKTLGEGLQALALASDRVDVDAILEAQGVPLLSDEEVAAQQAIDAEQAAEDAAQGIGQGDAADGVDPGAAAPADAPVAARAQARAQTALAVAARAQARAQTALAGAVRRRSYAGLAVVVEHPAGSIRIHHGPDGAEIPVKMMFDYGYLEGWLGSDGEELDCYLGPDENVPDVHVVHQLRAPAFRAHDEDKVMLGFPSADLARDAYLAHRGEPRALSGISIVPLDRFKAKLRRRGPESTSRIRASVSVARAQTVAALLRLAGHTATTLRRGKAGKGKYHDRLRRKGQELAARALAVDLTAIRDEIAALPPGPDWPARLKKRVLERYRGSKTADQLAEIVRKTNILAHLFGNDQAIKEV